MFDERTERKLWSSRAISPGHPRPRRTDGRSAQRRRARPHGLTQPSSEPTRTAGGSSAIATSCFATGLSAQHRRARLALRRPCSTEARPRRSAGVGRRQCEGRRGRSTRGSASPDGSDSSTGSNSARRSMPRATGCCARRSRRRRLGARPLFLVRRCCPAWSPPASGVRAACGAARARSSSRRTGAARCKRGGRRRPVLPALGGSLNPAGLPSSPFNARARSGTTSWTGYPSGVRRP